MIYGNRSNGNPHGLVLTKPIVVNFMLDRVGYSPNYDLRNLKVIEPAAGDGAFAIAILERLHASSLNFDFSFQLALQNLTFFEIDPATTELLQRRINDWLFEFSESIPIEMIRKADFLLSSVKSCDLIVGNPPYVRHENIPESQKIEYRKRFSSFRHRSDLYIAFFEKSLGLLNNRGILSFICSNRWLKNQYGRGLRELIKLAYTLDEVIDLESSSPFEEEVIAYPAITTIRSESIGVLTKYYQIENISQLNDLGIESIQPRILNTKSSTNWFSYESTEPSHQKYLDSIENQGFKIGIGVATGSDQVFIGKDLNDNVEKELLLPILMSKDLKNNQINWSGNFIINPFNKNGDLIDLNKYPKAKEYLESNRNLLDKRHIAKKNPNSWYKTIDRINPELTSQTKILLPDISGNTHLHIDRGNFYPHHNLYFITGANYEKLIILSALLMSDFVKNQLLQIGNKMNGGYPRWQSQNLRKLRLPVIDAMPTETIETLIKAYKIRDYSIINELITENQISEYSFNIGQTTLFEPNSEPFQFSG